MPVKRKVACVQCGREQREAGRISRTGLCADCGNANMRANIAQLIAHEGPYYERYLVGLRVAAERIAFSREARRSD